jgi:hypothetical protein
MKIIVNLFISVEILILRHRIAREYRKMLKARKHVAELVRLSRRDVDGRLRRIRRKQILLGVAKATIKRNAPSASLASAGTTLVASDGQGEFRFA